MSMHISKYIKKTRVLLRPHLPVCPVESVFIECNREWMEHATGDKQLSVRSIIASTLNIGQTSINPIESLRL